MLEQLAQELLSHVPCGGYELMCIWKPGAMKFCNVFWLLQAKCNSHTEIHYQLIVLTGCVARRSIPIICLCFLSYNGAWRLLFTLVGMLFILLQKWVSQWILIVAGLFLALLGHQLLSYCIYQHDWQSVGGRPSSMTSIWEGMLACGGWVNP